MFNIVRWYNQNRKKIWKIILIILIILLVIQIINYMYETKIFNKSNNTNISSSNINYIGNVIITEDTSGITGESISENDIKLLQVLNDFVAYCNEANIEEAYKLISDECKDEIYSNIEIFRNSYYNVIFQGNKKNVSIDNWIGNTYKVSYNEDFLSTGKYSEENTIQDYITIVKDANEEYKLNINKYISRKLTDRSEKKRRNTSCFKTNRYIYGL